MAESSFSKSQQSLLIAEDNLQNMKAAFKEEKAALLKRAEEAEAKLEPVTEELSALKRHITNMTVAIFGK